jgi:hypothetical protein
MMRAVRSLALSLVLAGGCRDRRAPTPPTAPPPATHAAPAPLAAADAATAPLATTDPRGAAHVAVIDATATARHGDAAITLDAGGEARLWTALDGSAPPRPIAALGMLDPRVERAGDTIVVGAVLPGGVGYLGVHHGDGAPATEVTIDSADGEVVAVVPTIDARAAVIARADQALELVALDGSVRARVELGRERLRAVAAIGPDGVLAILRTPDERFLARRYRVRGAALGAAADVALPGAPLDGRPIAVSPDGTRVATFCPLAPPALPSAPSGAGAAAPSGPGRPVPDRAPVAVPPAAPITVQLVELATGKDVMPDALVGRTYDDPQRLAFSARDRLHVSPAITLDLAGVGAVATDVGAVTGGFSAGDGVVVGGVGAALAVARPGRPFVYLGYRVTMPRAIALSPDGAQLAVAGFAGTVVVDRLDGSQPSRTIAVETGAQPIFVGFLDDARLLVVDEGEHAIVYDIASGAVAQLMPVPDSRSVALHPRRGWLFGVRSSGGFWAVRLDGSSPQPLGAPVTVDDRSTLIAPVAAADGNVVATLAAGKVFRYTADDLETFARARKKRPAPASTAPMSGGDQRGHFYVARGAEVAIVDLDGRSTSWTLPTAIEALWPLPAGGVLTVTAAAGGFTAHGLDGAPRWTVAGGPGVIAVAGTSDGGLLAIATPGGALVVDAATGERRAALCGWGFGAWDQPASDTFGGAVSVCR